MKQSLKLPSGIFKSMEKIVNYMFKDECAHFEETYDVEYKPGKKVAKGVWKKDMFVDSDGKQIELKDIPNGKNHIFINLLKVNDYINAAKSKKVKK